MDDLSKVKDAAGGVTFPVADVEWQAESPLPEECIRQATRRLLDGDFESCADFNSSVVAMPGIHPLIAAAHAAFCDHRPVVFSPDIIWITLIQGIANHINLDPEMCRDYFVAHEGRQVISVREDDFVVGTIENPWQDVFSQFSEKIEENIGTTLHKRIICDFTTTGAVERAVSEIALMDCMQSYFIFRLESMCGIPSVTLEGEAADWEHLAEKLREFSDLPGLDWWFAQVVPVADQFARAARGDVEPGFWNDIYKLSNMSGGPFIDGWLVKLMPYLKDPRTDRASVQNPGSVVTSDLPSSLSQVPFRWDYRGDSLDYEFLGGLVAIEQDPRSLALRPKVGWAVRPRKEEENPLAGRLDAEVALAIATGRISARSIADKFDVSLVDVEDWMDDIMSTKYS